MKRGGIVPFVRASLFDQPLRLALSVAGVAAALILMLLLLGFRAGLYQSISAYVDNSGADLFIGQKGATGVVASSSAIPIELADEVARASGADAVQPVTIVDIIFQHNGEKTPVILVGYEPGHELGGPWSIVAGREPNSESDEILLDEALAGNNEIEVSDKVEIFGRRLEVVGLTSGTSNWMSPFLFLPTSTLARSLGDQETVSFFLLRLEDGADAASIAETLESKMDDIHAMPPSLLAEHDRAVLAEVMETPLMVMLAISFVIGTAVLGLTSYSASLDRLREYGVLKAIGASPGRMRSWLLQESLYRGALGYSLGAVGALAAGRMIEELWPQFTVVIEPVAFLVTAVSLIVMAILGALLPLRRVERLEPAAVFKA